MRLAAKLARAAGLIHPMDWVRVYESHNRYEWKMQIALEQVEPWGDDRADLRAAVNTASLLAAQATQEVSEADMARQIHNLQSYLKIHQPEE